MRREERAPSDPVVVGRVVRPHGLAGEIVVEPADPGSKAFDAGGELWLAGRWRTVRSCRTTNQGRRVIAIVGLDDRDAAEAVRGAEIGVEASSLPELEDDRFYVHDLVGCGVRDAGGAELGVVVGVVPGPQDCLEVEHHGRKSLIPMVRELVKDVDVARRSIVIDPPAGLAETTHG